MFTKSARLYDALYESKDYAGASEKLRHLLQLQNPGAKTLLDVGCGTGKHLERLREYYAVEGLDLSPEMLEIARSRCPDVVFTEGNMISFDLGRTFDVVVCLFNAIAYVKTVENLDRVIVCMARHLQPGGVLVVEPWFSPENYWVGGIHANFLDRPDMKVAWMYVRKMRNCNSYLDIHCLVGTPDGIECFTEQHELGLFTQEEYFRAFRKAGIDVQYDPEGLFKRGLYWGKVS
jgi:ubiquinone/menaquinone biosynthesis C-methylase UbiE